MFYLKNTLILLIISLLSFSSCSDDNEAPSTKVILQQGKWKITSFSNNGADETNKFSGYVFTFAANGQVTAVKSGNPNITGTWTTGADESLNKITFNFGLLSFPDLNQEWNFLTKSYTGFSLQYLSSANGGSTDNLAFEKL